MYEENRLTVENFWYVQNVKLYLRTISSMTELVLKCQAVEMLKVTNTEEVYTAGKI